MIVVIGEAAHSEVPGGYGYEGAIHKLGNQTGEELRRYLYYNAPWTHVFRWKNMDMAMAFATRILQAILNTKIGYSQPGRASFYKQLNTVRDPSKIKVKCDCDCSQLQNGTAKLTLDMEGVKTRISGTEVTAQMPFVYNSDPNFVNVTANVNLETGEGLQIGDILVKNGHTASVTNVYDQARIGMIKKFTAVYTQPKVRKRYHNPIHEFVGPGNLANILESDHPSFYFCEVAGVVGYIRKKCFEKGFIKLIS